MLGRKLIIMNWKASTVPAPSMWCVQLGKLAALSFRLSNRMELYHQKWGLYHAYMDRSWWECHKCYGDVLGRLCGLLLCMSYGWSCVFFLFFFKFLNVVLLFLYSLACACIGGCLSLRFLFHLVACIFLGHRYGQVVWLYIAAIPVVFVLDGC